MRAVVLVFCAMAVFAQPKPKFDVASVKACGPKEPRTTNGGTISLGRVHFNCLSLTTYIRHAYGFYGNGATRSNAGHTVKIEGGPAWVNTEEYRIDATASGVTEPGILDGSMMQSLLEERFKLKVHRETRQMPVYALVAGKGGLKAPAAKVACFVPGSGRATWKPGDPRPPICGLGKPEKGGVEIYGASIEDFCLTAWRSAIIDRQIIDRTGISGRYDFDLLWPSADVEEMRTPDGRFNRVQGAVERLGLKLVDAMGPVEFIVIDHAERPTAN